MANPYMSGPLTDVGLSTQPNTTDFGFLQNQLSRSNQQYQQGLDQVKNDYSSILNQAVTGQEATDRKQQYISQVQEGLKKVAPTDLSLPQNVAQAENLYAPFWQDKELLYNIANTRDQNGQIDQYKSYLNSTDKDKRVLASPDALEYMQRGLKKLAETPLNQQDKWSVRNFVPVYDMNREADDEFVKIYGAKGGPQSSYANGPVTEVVTNGPQSKEAYRSWYLSRADVQSKYAPQIKMKAVLNMERNMDQIQDNAVRQTGRRLNEAALHEQFTQETVDRLKDHYQDAIKSASKTADYWQNEIDKMKIAHPVPTEEDGVRLTQLMMNKKSWDDMRQSYENKYGEDMGWIPPKGDKPGYIDKDSPAYKSMLREMQEHPGDYLAQIYKGQMADNWANGMASISQVEFKANAAWNNLVQHEDRKSTLALDAWKAETHNVIEQYKLDEKEQELAFKYGKWPERVTAGKGATLTGPNVATGDIFHDPTTPQQVGVSLDTYHENQEGLRNSINNQVFSYDGLSGLLSKSVLGDKLGLDDEDIVAWSQAMKGARNGIPISKEHYAAVDRVTKIMENYGVKGIDGPASALLGTMQFVQKVAKDLPADKAYDMLSKVENIQYELDTYNKNEDEFKKNVNLLTQRNPKYNILINKETGLPYTTEEKATDVQPVTVTDKDGTPVALSKMELARAWDKGDVKFKQGSGSTGYGSSVAGMPLGYTQSDSWDVTINGKNYRVPVNTFAAVEQKYSNYEKTKSLKDEAGEQILKNMSAYKNGRISGVASYDYSGKDAGNNSAQQQTAFALGKEISRSENTTDIYTTDGKNKKDKTLDSDKQELIRNLLSHGEGAKDNIATIEYHQLGPEGVPAWKVSFQPGGKDSKSDNSSQKAMGDLAGKSVWMTQSAAAQGNLIQQMPQRHDVYVYGKLLEGETIRSQPITEALGVKYSITHGDTRDPVSGNYTTALITYQKQQVNPVTGEVEKDKDGNSIWITEKQSVPLMRGKGAMNPDELMANIRNYSMVYMQDKAGRVKGYAQQAMNPNAMTWEQLDKKILGQIGGSSSSSSGNQGGDISTKTNNPGNIKWNPMLSKYGASNSGIPASDGGTFAKFPSVDIGFKMHEKQLFGTTDGTFHSNYYKPDTTVNEAMKIWSNNGYGGEIYPQVAHKKLADLTPTERKELIKRQQMKESPQMYKKLYNTNS